MPLPAVGAVTPWGSSAGGHCFSHAASQEVLPAFSTYSVVPAARTVPTLATWAVEITVAVVGPPPAAAAGAPASANAPAANARATTRPTWLRHVAGLRCVCFMSGLPFSARGTRVYGDPRSG